MSPLALLVASLGLSDPTDVLMRVDCPFPPVFFSNSEARIDAAGQRILAAAYDPFLDTAQRDIGIVLRTYTREEEAVVIGTGLQLRRAEAVRNAFIADGVAPDRILIAHEWRSGPDYAPEGWVGGWVLPEFYVRRSVFRLLFPDDTIC